MSDPIWAFARRIGIRLGLWSAASLAVAAALAAFEHPTTAAFALQCAVWGAIDGAIALLGERDRRRRWAAANADPAVSERFRVRLLRILWLAAISDVAYLAVGVGILAWVPTPAGLGHGLGVLVQGGFLLAFDIGHALRMPRSAGAFDFASSQAGEGVARR